MTVFEIIVVSIDVIQLYKFNKSSIDVIIHFKPLGVVYLPMGYDISFC